MLTFTAAARDKAAALLSAEPGYDCLRIGVQAGGCSGLRYQLYFDDQQLAGDVSLDMEGLLVRIDALSAPYLTGASVDFIDRIDHQGFAIENPNAAGSCACGDSFH